MFPIQFDQRGQHGKATTAFINSTDDGLSARPSSHTLPHRQRSTSTSSLHSAVSFYSDASSTTTLIEPPTTHSVWFSPTSPYPRMLFLLLALSFTFTFGFCIASRLSCALGHFVIGKLTPGAEPRALAVLATVITILVPANFIAAFMFHFAKAQPGAEKDECDLTRPSGWWQLCKQLISAAVNFVTPRCVRSDGAVMKPAINEPVDSAPPSSLSILSIPRSLFLLLTAFVSFLFTAQTPIGLWLRNGCLDTISTLLTLFPSYLHNAFHVEGYYSPAIQQFMYRVFGEQWVTLVTYGLMVINTTRTVVLLPVWYRNIPWRQQLSIEGTPVIPQMHNTQCEVCLQLNEAAAENKHKPCTIQCASVSNVSPVGLSRHVPSIVRCSSIADTASPHPSPRSDVSDHFNDCAPSSGTFEHWQLDEAAPARSKYSDAEWMASSHSFSSTVSSSASVAPILKGSRSVMWLFLVLVMTGWYVFLLLTTGIKHFGLQYLAHYVVPITVWTNTHPTLILCICFGTLVLFLVIDYVRHNRQSTHKRLAFTAVGCDCRTPYLILLCLLLSLDSIYYFIITPFSAIISQSYLALDSSLHERAFSVLTFYALMLVWQLIVRCTAMHALPRGSSLAVLFPILLIEDVWADLIFTSFTPFSLSFFAISVLHLSKTFIRDFDLLPSILLYLPTLVASPSTASLRGCLTQTSSWRLAFPRRVLRHQNLVTELCAKVVVVAVLCGDMVGEGVLGPPMILIDPNVPFNGVYWNEQKRQRGMIVGALVFLMLQQCVVHAVVLRALGWIDAMEQKNKAEEAETADAAAVTEPTEPHHVDDTFAPMCEAAVEAVYDSSSDMHTDEAERPTFGHSNFSHDDTCRVPYHSADYDNHSCPVPISPLPRSISCTSSIAESYTSSVSSEDGTIVWLDRHWKFHFLFFACCIVRLVSVMLSLVSSDLHNVYFDNRLMCVSIPWMTAVGYQGNGT